MNLPAGSAQPSAIQPGWLMRNAPPNEPPSRSVSDPAMPVLAVLITLGATVPQEEARGWIEKLRSEEIEERDRATAELKRCGRAAVAELERFAQDPDPDVSSRVHYILRSIEIDGRLGPV